MKQGVRGARWRIFSAAAVVFLWLVGSLATAREAEACSCRRPQTVCDAVNRADLIFSGKVVEVRKLRPGSAAYSPYVTAFEVKELFLGKVNGADKFVRIIGEHCDDTFKLGQVMLVYATQGSLGPQSGCSRTRLLDDAQEDLKELRSLKDQINGKAVGSITVIAHNADPKPLPNVTVHLISPEKHRAESTTTDAQGNYQLELPLGTYSLKVEAPPSLISDGEPHNVLQVRHPGACARGDASFKRNGVITGTVIGKLKKPVRGVSVYALDVQSQRQEGDELPVAITDKRGNFRIEGLAAAVYLLVVSPDGITPESPYPTTYALGARTPDTARRYDLIKELRSLDNTFILPPPHPVHPVTVRVLQDGRPTEKPVEITNVSDQQRVLDANPDNQGTVRLKALAGPIKWEVCLHELASQAPKKSCATVERDLKRAVAFDVTVPSADEP